VGTTLARSLELGAKTPHFTRTDEASVEKLAAVLGIKHRFLPDGAINHTTVITLLGPRGELLERVDGTDQPIGNLVEKLRGLTAAAR
jgi:cytochrome oxidase Cu insertion factor (SCO1/SenC/PrrC family)